MKKGFTLAEVLITLAIIGVVAALTIPTVISKYQKNQYYTQFMKAYNTLSTAYQMSVAQNGDYQMWNLYDESNPDYYKQFEKYIYSYLKIDRICSEDNRSNCPSSYVIKHCPFNNCQDSPSDFLTDLVVGDFGVSPDLNIVFLQDGSAILSINYYDPNDGIAFIVDTNGIKAPNTVGRDIFCFAAPHTYDGTTRFLPCGMYAAGEFVLEEDIMLNCSDSDDGSASSCGARLLLEGKMDY